MNLVHAVIGNTVSTSGTAAVTILASQGDKVFKDAVLYNPSSSGAGVWSMDGFVTQFPFAAGPSLTHMFPEGTFRNAVQIKRTTATDVSGAIVGSF